MFENSLLQKRQGEFAKKRANEAIEETNKIIQSCKFNTNGIDEATHQKIIEYMKLVYIYSKMNCFEITNRYLSLFYDAYQDVAFSESTQLQWLRFAANFISHSTQEKRDEYCARSPEAIQGALRDLINALLQQLINRQAQNTALPNPT